MSLLYERRLESCYIERIYPYSESNAFLGVSICSRLFSEKTLIALFDWCKVNVKSVYVLIADEIQMYTFMASKGLCESFANRRYKVSIHRKGYQER